MKSDEARIAEAVAALTARLESWDVEEATEKATTYVHDMLRNGWRPRARPVEEPPKPGGGCKPTADYLAAKKRRAESDRDSDEQEASE